MERNAETMLAADDMSKDIDRDNGATRDPEPIAAAASSVDRQYERVLLKDTQKAVALSESGELDRGMIDEASGERAPGNHNIQDGSLGKIGYSGNLIDFNVESIEVPHASTSKQNETSGSGIDLRVQSIVEGTTMLKATLTFDVLGLDDDWEACCVVEVSFRVLC